MLKEIFSKICIFSFVKKKNCIIFCSNELICIFSDRKF